MSTNEIVVTAQKREENVQDVPIAITPLSADELTSAGIDNAETLRIAVPSLNYANAVGGFAQPTLRGIGGTGTGPGLENSVAAYVDGVYIGSQSAAVFNLLDVGQVAVLKGPQGTLFGRNATGGVIQVTTRAPTREFTADFYGTYGNYETYGARAYLSGPLGDRLAASAAFQFNNRDEGFGVNLATGTEVQTEENVAGRAKLVWDPTDATKLTLSGDYAHFESVGPAFRNVGITIFGVPTPGGDYDINHNFDPSLETESSGGSATIDHDFGGVTFKSITAYRDSSLSTRFDPDGVLAPILDIVINQDEKQFTQELELVSDSDGPLQWVVGAFYLDGEAGYVPNTTDIVNTFTGFVGRNILTTEQTLESIAGFAQATYAVTDATNVTLGARYTEDKRHFTAQQTTIGIAPFPFTNPFGITPVDEERTFSRTTWRASVDHRFSPQLLGYVSFNTGFKAGSFAPQTFDPFQVLEPELIEAYEAGFKSDLFEDRVRLNVSAFWYDYTNIQVQQIVNGVQLVFNGEGAEVSGADADFDIQVSENFSLFGGLSWTDATYTQFTGAVITAPLPAGGNSTIIGDVSGNNLENAPEFTFSLGGNYIIPTEAGAFELAAGYNFNDGYNTTPDNRIRQDSFHLLNAALKWSSVNERFSAELWGKNLLDELYVYQLGSSNFGDNAVYAPPRTYGLTLGLHF